MGNIPCRLTILNVGGELISEVFRVYGMSKALLVEGDGACIYLLCRHADRLSTWSVLMLACKITCYKQADRLNTLPQTCG